MRFVGGVKRRGVFHFRDDRFPTVHVPVDFSGIKRMLYILDGFLRYFFLFRGVREDHRGVLRADVVALSVERT